MHLGEVAVDLDAEMVRLALAVIGQAGLGLDLTTAVDIVPAKDGVMHKMCLRFVSFLFPFSFPRSYFSQYTTEIRCRMFANIYYLAC